MAGFPLTGIDPSDPIPGIKREIRFAQGDASGAGASRDVLIFGNKTSGGTETADTIGAAIVGLDDCIARFGQRSELTLLYRKYVEIDQDATIYGCAITESGGIAADVAFTFATNASGSTTVKITVIGETVEVGVESGDTPTVIAVACKDKINSQTHWPLTAANSSGVLTLTAANVGPRTTNIMDRARMSFTVSAGTTVSKGAVTSGTTADDNTAALAAAAAGEYYYQIGPYNITSSATATDNGLGEHASFITTQALPANGKDQMLFCGLVGTQAQATTVATSVNNVLVQFFHAEDNDWTAGMIAAHCCAAIRSKQIGYASANMTDYGLRSGDIFNIPDPYDKTDRPTTTEVRADLNNGVSPIGFTNSGRSYMVRQIGSYSVLGSFKDYRAREGHIPSAIHKFWATVKAKHFSHKQAVVASEPVQGAKPLEGVTYPSAVRADVIQVMDDMVNNAGGPILDPGTLDKQKGGVVVLELADGISCRARPIACRHHNKSQFLIEEMSSAY